MLTMQNTEGYSQADLDTLNSAVNEILPPADFAKMGACLPDYRKAVDDAVQNAWFAGRPKAEIVSAARRTLGI